MIVKLLTEHHLEFLSLKGGFPRLVRVYICQNDTLLEISCIGSFLYDQKVILSRIAFGLILYSI